MVLEALAEAMMGLIDWGRGIIVFLIVMELFKASRGTDAAAALGSGAKSVWKGLEARIPGTISKAKRVYKEEYSHEKAVTYIKEEVGKHFDPDVVKAFLNRADEFIAIKEKNKN